MNSAIRMLHVSYWFGAILDAVMVVPLLVPKVAGAMFGIDGFAPGRDFRYVGAVGAALMAGWAVLLIWGDRKPIERRGVLLITAFPVVVGMFAAGVYANGSGLVRLPYLVPTFVMQVGLLVLFVVSYLRAGTVVSTARR